MPRNFYPTPYEAVIPLLPHLPEKSQFIEPMAGDGRLIAHLEKHGHKCVYACDIEPKGPGIDRQDILFFGNRLPWCELIITNPIWEREPLHQTIEILKNHAPCWLLFDADWKYTRQSANLIQYCSKIIAVGRVKWIEGSKMSGKDNCAWHRFEKEKCETIFVGRTDA